MDETDVRRLLSEGEGQQVEFKQSFNESNQAIRSLCAFANASGGTVVFGVRDNGQQVNLSLGANTLETLSNDLKQNTDPLLVPEVVRLTYNGRDVVTANIRGHQKGELFTAYGQALVRVGKTNLVMPPSEMRARLQEGLVDWTDESDRPRFEVSITGVSRRENEFTPGFRVMQASGDKVRSVEWRIRGPRFQGMAWRAVQVSAFDRAHFAAKFNLSTDPVSDDRLALDEMGLEIRFTWRGKERHELHRWPISRRVLTAKVLWDVGEVLPPPLEWDEELQTSTMPTLPEVVEPVQVQAMPVSNDGHVHLSVTNRAATQKFVADAVDFDGIMEPQQRYALKWRGHDEESRELFTGRDALLDVVQVMPPEINPLGLQHGIRQGVFHLFSTSLRSGWDVHAGKSGWMDIREALKESNPFEATIALKIRITGSLGVGVTKRITIGFNQPDALGPAIWARVDEWPEESSELADEGSA